MASEVFTAEWFPYYFERFEGSDRVAMMSLAEEGAYHRAIRLAWKYGSVPSDPATLAAKIQKRCTPKIAGIVLTCFEPVPGDPSKMQHPVVEAIRAEQHQKYLNRVKGGKAASEKAKEKAEKEAKINVANKGTSSISPAELEQQSSSKRDRDRDRDLERKEKAAEEPPLLEIHTGKIIAGVCKNLGVQKLSMSVQREFENEALTAFENRFTPEAFIECHGLLRQLRPYTIKASYITDQLPDLDKLRQKVIPVEKPKRRLARDLIAEERKREEALAGL